MPPYSSCDGRSVVKDLLRGRSLRLARTKRSAVLSELGGEALRFELVALDRILIALKRLRVLSAPAIRQSGLIVSSGRVSSVRAIW